MKAILIGLLFVFAILSFIICYKLCNYLKIENEIFISFCFTFINSFVLALITYVLKSKNDDKEIQKCSKGDVYIGNIENVNYW